jgi:hypothetical protein
VKNGLKSSGGFDQFCLADFYIRSGGFEKNHLATLHRFHFFSLVFSVKKAFQKTNTFSGMMQERAVAIQTILVNHGSDVIARMLLVK